MTGTGATEEAAALYTDCHPERSEGPVQFAGSAPRAASCTGPSARKRRGPQDDKKVGERAVRTGGRRNCSSDLRKPVARVHAIPAVLTRARRRGADAVSTRFRPLPLARYRALSAASMIWLGSDFSCVAAATPMLTVTESAPGPSTCARRRTACPARARPRGRTVRRSGPRGVCRRSIPLGLKRAASITRRSCSRCSTTSSVVLPANRMVNSSPPQR